MQKKLIISALVLTMGLNLLTAQVQHFTWQNQEREYIIHTPANRTGSIPVMFYLHGLTVQIVPCDQEYHFAELSDELGWAIVVPQALNQGIGTMWSAGLSNSDIDDVGFLLALLDTLTIQYDLNSDSVFFTGFSMGGFMTHRMAIEHGDRITACAPVSGLIAQPMSLETPVVPVRMLHVHGTQDYVVGYNGSSTVFGATLGLGVEAILDYWQTANNCSGEPVIDTLPDLHDDGLRFVHYTYNCGTDLQLLKVLGGAHSWYHSAQQYDVAYMDVICRFFKGEDIVSAIHTPEMNPLHVSPNPAAGLVSVEVDEPSVISVFDAQGQMVEQQEVEPGRSWLDLSRLPNGLYIVKDQRGGTTKVVLQR